MDDAFDEEDGDTIILIEDDEEEAAGDTAGVQTAADDSDNEARQDEDQNIESNTNDPLEFNAPKQQWGRFFTGQYEGPIIEAVGPLHEDQEERIPGPFVGDYAGLPVNAAAQLRADSWQPSLLTLPEHQCKPHPSTYGFRGVGNLYIWQELDPKSLELIRHYFYCL